MLLNQQEYAAMHAVEENHWWYKTLHRKVWERIPFNSYEKIKVLDVGCGTGGFLLKCKENAKLAAQGIDFSEYAIDFSAKRGLEVKKASVFKLYEHFPASSFDVVVCNDVFYQFEKDEIIQALLQIQIVLKPGGLLIANNQAFEVFRGTHDIAVGAKIRFIKTDFDEYLGVVSKLKIKEAHYWSVILSGPILLLRALQRLQLRLGWIKASEIKSDVKPTANWINNLLFLLLKWEEKLFPIAPFGSSLFMVFEKK
jgi:SAM-dependent methyltransferase